MELCENCRRPAKFFYVTAKGEKYPTCGDCNRGAVDAIPIEPPKLDLGDRLTFSRGEAAQVLGISVDHLERHVIPKLRVVQSGRRQLIQRSELEAYLSSNAARALKK